MATATEMLKRAIPYLDDAEMRKEYSKFVRQLVMDLEEVAYEESEEMSDAANRLEQAINDFDETVAGVEKNVELDDDEIIFEEDDE